jgi:hypothetical protein
VTEVTLITPEAADTPAPAATGDQGAGASASAAAAPQAAQGSEAGEGDAAAAAGQGAGDDQAANGSVSEGAGAEGAKDGEGAATGAPEAYADFTMPEGFQIDAEYGGELSTIAKELNLPQDKAQKLVDLGVKHAQNVVAALKTQQTEAIAGWVDAVRNDPEIGGSGLTENMATAKRAVVAFGTPELVGLLNETGLSRHPDVVRFMVRVGAAISEDTDLVSGDGNGAGPGQQDRAKKLYPNQK